VGKIRAIEQEAARLEAVKQVNPNR